MSTNSPLPAPLGDIADYYSQALATHGESPRGVDWNSAESQTLRFEQLTRVIREPAGFSLLDLGCGYGALFDYLDPRFRNFSYQGYDISAEMVGAARRRLRGQPNARISLGAQPGEPADYAVASGVFNVRLQRSDSSWFEYILATLDALHAASRRGFSFNCLTSYSDADRMRDYLYYADPRLMFDHCKRRYSPQVALLHDYGLYEFTILVRK